MMTRQTANDQAKQMLTALGLHGEGVYAGSGISLESQLARHISLGRPYRAFTDDGRVVVYDGNGNTTASPTNAHAFH